jgi:VWFA-related protein
MKEEGMKIRWMVVTLAVLLLLGSAIPAGAQGVVNLTIDDLRFDQFPVVETLVTARNENGVPIGDLGVNQFEIVEDGRASFPPSEVAAHVNPQAVVSVMMVIDISGSMKGKPIQEAMRAANALIDQLSVQDRVALIAFADSVNIDLEQPLAEGKELGFTTDKNAARNLVNFLDSKIGWDTPLYDAIYKGVKMVSAEPVGKRALIVMTDGRDERDNAQGVAVPDAGSLSAPDDPINEANRHNIPIFSIGLVGLGGKIDTKYLQRLAERTGGRFQQAPQPEELTPLFENVLAQLKQQYLLKYTSRLTQDGNYHSLLVRVQLPQGQAFAETKFSFSPEVAPTQAPAPPTSASNPEPTSTTAVLAQVGETPSPGETPPPVVSPPPDPEPTGIAGILDTVRDTISEKPLLAAVIGGGVLLLIILIIALLIVLLRGRGAPEEEFVTAGYDQAYSPAPGWTSDPTSPGTPVMGSAVEGETEVAPSDWPAPSAAPAPFAPVQPAGPIPEAGSTRIIERAPKHLAMLVDKARPDRKYDLKGTTNIGRGTDNHIVLDDPTVSRHHAWIKVEGEDFLVFDIGSGNGTFVNDERIEEPRYLKNGDVVRFGEAQFVFTKVF